MLVGIALGAFGVYGITSTMRSAVRDEKSRLEAERGRLNQLRQELSTKQKEIDRFNSQVVSYNELTEENKILKRDLQNVDVRTYPETSDSL